MPERKIIFTRSRIADVSASGCCCCCLRRKEFTREARGGTAGGRAGERYTAAWGDHRGKASHYATHTHTTWWFVYRPLAYGFRPFRPYFPPRRSVRRGAATAGRPGRAQWLFGETVQRNVAEGRRSFFRTRRPDPFPYPLPTLKEAYK